MEPVRQLTSQIEVIYDGLTHEDIFEGVKHRSNYPKIKDFYSKLISQTPRGACTPNKYSMEVIFHNRWRDLTRAFLDFDDIVTNSFIQRIFDERDSSLPPTLLLVNTNVSGREYLQSKHTTKWVPLPDGNGYVSISTLELNFMTTAVSAAISFAHATVGLETKFIDEWKTDMQQSVVLTRRIKEWRETGQCP